MRLAKRFFYLVALILIILILTTLFWHRQLSSYVDTSVPEKVRLSQIKVKDEANLKNVHERIGLLAKGDAFTLDGKEITIISGAVHYFRFPEQYWRDRLMKMKACGLNSIETYVPWNLHEPTPGKFDFSGNLDIVNFLLLANELDLLVLLRPGPYICAEWEFGGLPSWLLRDPNMKVRTMYPNYIDAVDRYFEHLLPLLKPLQYKLGGPIVAFQLDNEYGAYFMDNEYLPFLKELVLKHGINELLFTSDNMDGLKKQTIPGVLKTVNFKHVENHYDELKSIQPNAPLMTMEFWSGWFDWWGAEHHTMSVLEFAEELNEILSLGASVNFYMFYGGTTFGFMNGGFLEKDIYRSDITSYDYDAPISENGDLTPKYYKTKSIIARYYPEYVPDDKTHFFSDKFPRTAYSDIAVTGVLPVWEVLSLVPLVRTDVPVPMEMLDINNGAGQSYGYTLYSSEIDVMGKDRIEIDGVKNVRDRGTFFIDGILHSRICNETNETTIEVLNKNGKEKVTIDVLIENGGRINYKHLNDQRKGLTGPLIAGASVIKQWKIYPLEMKADFISQLFKSKKWEKFQEKWKLTSPTFLKTTLTIHSEPHDTYLDMSEWGKGIAFVNGKNLGRYWSVGPQRTLYLPAPWLQAGENEIVIFEELNCSKYIKFLSEPILG